MPGPMRQATERDVVQTLNGSALFLGALVSTGAAVNNLTTATPFNQTALGPVVSPPNPAAPPNYTNTLAGKTLLLQTTAAGLIMASFSPNMTVGQVPGQNIIALQTVLPPLAGTAPGVALTSGERVIVTMMAFEGWLQWLPLTSGNLLVWELR